MAAAQLLVTKWRSECCFINTGKDLDIEVLTKYCKTCEKHTAGDKKSPEYIYWKEGRHPVYFTFLQNITNVGNVVAQVPASYDILPDMTRSIGDFNGGCASASRRVATCYRELHRWPPAFQLETARSDLVGAARSWCQTRREKMASWEDFESEFKLSFSSDLRLTEKFEGMQSRALLHDEI